MKRKVVADDSSNDKHAPPASPVTTDKTVVNEILTPPVVCQLAMQTPTIESMNSKDVSYDDDDDDEDENSENCDIHAYKLKKIDKLNEFAQDKKAIYLMQFITSEEQIAYGSMIQKEVCKMVKVANGMNLSVWDEGGKSAFHKGILSKRKTIMYMVQGAVKNVSNC